MLSRSLADQHRFRRQVDHLHRLGRRPLGEFLDALVEIDPASGRHIARLLDEYGTLHPDVLRIIGADRWQPLPIREVA